jgi:hypothetical protein
MQRRRLKSRQNIRARNGRKREHGLALTYFKRKREAAHARRLLLGGCGERATTAAGLKRKHFIFLKVFSSSGFFKEALRLFFSVVGVALQNPKMRTPSSS